MVFLFGLDLDGDRSVDNVTLSADEVDELNNNAFQTAITKGDAETSDSIWSRVVSVTAHLLLYSSPVGTSTKNITFDGKDYSDTRYRRAFDTTINIRNRTP